MNLIKWPKLRKVYDEILIPETFQFTLKHLVSIMINEPLGKMVGPQSLTSTTMESYLNLLKRKLIINAIKRKLSLDEFKKLEFVSEGVRIRYRINSGNWMSRTFDEEEVKELVAVLGDGGLKDMNCLITENLLTLFIKQDVGPDKRYQF